MTLESQFRINHNTQNLQLTHHLNNATTNKQVRKRWPCSQWYWYHYAIIFSQIDQHAPPSAPCINVYEISTERCSNCGSFSKRVETRNKSRVICTLLLLDSGDGGGWLPDHVWEEWDEKMKNVGRKMKDEVVQPDPQEEKANGCMRVKEGSSQSRFAKQADRRTEESQPGIGLVIFCRHKWTRTEGENKHIVDHLFQCIDYRVSRTVIQGWRDIRRGKRERIRDTDTLQVLSEPGMWSAGEAAGRRKWGAAWFCSSPMCWSLPMSPWYPNGLERMIDGEGTLS